MRGSICQIDISTVYIHDHASLHLAEIVDHLSDMCMTGLHIVVVIEASIRIC